MYHRLPVPRNQGGINNGKEIYEDYNDFFDFEREDVLPLLELTRKLLAKLESLIAHP